MRRLGSVVPPHICAGYIGIHACFNAVLSYLAKRGGFSAFALSLPQALPGRLRRLSRSHPYTIPTPFSTNSGPSTNAFAAPGPETRNTATPARPAALAKAFRFVKDPRDSHQKDRLGSLNEENGVWDCTRCLQCVEVCPKDVDPMGRIMIMRDMAMEAGFNNTAGSRHTESFAKSVKKNGRLDEMKLAIDSMGRFNVPALLDSAPVGLRAMRKGKFPWKAHKSSEPAMVKRVFEKVEGE